MIFNTKRGKQAAIVAVTVVLVASGVGPFAAFGGLVQPDHGGTVSAHDVSSLTKNASISSDDTSQKGHQIANDGKKLYLLGASGDNIYEYELSEPYNISTATLNTTFDISGTETTPWGLEVKEDGTKIWVGGNDVQGVTEYKLSNPFDLSSASKESTVYTGDDTVYYAAAIEWNDDGTQLYLEDKNNGKIKVYDASTAYDSDTITLNQTFTPSNSPGRIHDIEFDNDGDKMYIMDDQNENLHEYNLSTPYDPTTESHYQTSSLSMEGGLTWGSEGEYMYAGQDDDKIHMWDATPYNPVVNGTVTDQDGNAVEDATVTAKNGSLETTTNSTGFYSFRIPEGDQTVKVSNTSYANESKTETIPSGGTTIDFTVGESSGGSSSYTQEFELQDYTGHFTDARLVIKESVVKNADGDNLTPETSVDWERMHESEFNHRNRTEAELQDGALYLLSVRASNPDGDAQHDIAGWEADNTSTLETIQIGENTTENATATATPTSTVTPDGSIKDDITVGTYPGGLRIKYNGEPIEEIEYDVQGPNGSTYRVNRSFDDPTSYFTADLNDTLTNNASEHPSDYAVDYNGTYADGEVFNGSSDVEAGLFSSATGDSSGGGGAFVAASNAGSGLSAPEAGLGLVALGVAGFAAYRRFAGGGGPPA